MGQIRQVSFAQQRLWFLDQLEPGNAAYNLVCAVRILGFLDDAALARALGMVIARHEPLRTVFSALDGRVVAVVGAAPEQIELAPDDLDRLPEDAREEHALGIAAGEARRPFDLSRGPLIRFKLLRLSPERHMLVMTMHHIVMDGWSIRVLLEEMGNFYEAFRANRPPDLPPLPLHYGDFAAWQRESFDDEAQTRQLQYWKRTLNGAPEVLDLPADRVRPAAPRHEGRRYTVCLDTRLTGDILELARRERVTPFMLLLAAFQTLLWRYTGVGDFVVGTAMAGRSHVELEPLIGLFVNTIPLRAKLGDNPEFRVLLQRARQSTLDALANQDVPFEKLIEELRPPRSMSYAPLFQTMFIVHNTPRTSFQCAGIRLEELEVDCGSSKFDLTVELFELDGLCCTWEYNTDLFDHARIVRMAGHFETLLRGICADPHRKLSELPLLTPCERNRILIEWNATESPFPDDVCIHEAFEDQAAHSADSIAVIDDERRLTYGQLNCEANRLAHYLQRHGVQPGDCVGVAMERSADAIVSLLAVMKTGASYVPIDPTYPKQRNEFMLQDSGARVLITQQRFRTQAHASHIFFLDRDRRTLLAESHHDLRVPVDCRQPAYVIYTSGSTGQPKGVLGTHRASMNRFAWMWKTYPFGDGEICAQRTSLSFVDSVAEIFGPLLKGTPLVVLSEETVFDPEALVRELARRRITRIVLVPSLLNVILEEIPDLGARLSALRFCFASGEALSYGLFLRFAKLLPQTTLVNLYGSSEVAADVTFFDSSNSPLGFVPIGKPIANVRVYLLDPNLNPVPIGVPGEIHVGGECLAGGYLDRPELTGSRFIPDPFRPGDLLFKTGDLGRYGDTGNVEFLGRQDNQIKLRGFRVEPGEIETALKSHGSVGDAVVRLSNRGPANRLLTAYVVPYQGQTVAHADLRRHLKNTLPDYMVPAAFITLDALPMTPNGKLDQLALAEIDPAEPRPSPGYTAPRNELEKTILAIWSEVLKIERIGVFDDFFELGGHSLLAAQVIARIRKHTEVEVPLRSLFEEPTAAALAKAVEKARANGAALKIPAAVQGMAQRTRSQLEERLRDLSDEELDALLNTVLTSRRIAGSANG